MDSSAPKIVEKTIIEHVQVEPLKPETKDASVNSGIQTKESSDGPDEISTVDAESYVDWFAENSRARRVQTTNVNNCKLIIA